MLLCLLAAAVLVAGPLSAANTPTVVPAAAGIPGKLARPSILSVAEVAALSRSGFPEAQLRAHLRSSRAIYRLNAHDIAELKAAGVGNAVIGEMLARPYAPAPVHRYARPGHRFYRAPFPPPGAGSFGGRSRFHGGGPRRH
ncbi:MAG: hypothetical protein HYX71_02000 [Opitutae bacterium]|nr:hypothetical protein [Opitutae bacterium]